MRNYDELVREVKSRTNPESISERRLFGENYEHEFKVQAPTLVLEYIKRAMDGVGEDYTRRSKEAGEAVKNHLKACLSNVDYEYQGSVMTNTHIRGNSDIDLLVISNLFHFNDWSGVDSVLNNSLEKLLLESYQLTNLRYARESSTSYQGNFLADLKRNRTESENKLTNEYDECNISKPKAIRLKNKNLHREVDVVIACWYRTVQAIKENEKKFRSIQIYDKSENSIGRVESPFVSIDRINSKDNSVNGRLKKMIRFLKNLKVDSGTKINLNSFDINAICYKIDINNYSGKKYYELVPVLVDEFYRLISNESYRNSVKSVDGSEYIFYGKPDKVKALRELEEELGKVFGDFQLIPNFNYSL
ncbi:nucleotidyltransferase family protein [Moheibacter sediminis]|uniref:cGAS/DncV-like nucleotidyltransferase C-terminal helical domain-containing protein n=1 Tax=Moheibacter sediminis TaxID=1434700 RepID=A0A1W1YLI9_9FLAO|nr:hypothetical protein [Moheibacter sediminis]SMC37110.1 hypothetical protein SAMN06296427_101537 [Moheibacter sediminis]